jgi:hypothetical protein
MSRTKNVVSLLHRHRVPLVDTGGRHGVVEYCVRVVKSQRCVISAVVELWPHSFSFLSEIWGRKSGGGHCPYMEEGDPLRAASQQHDQVELGRRRKCGRRFRQLRRSHLGSFVNRTMAISSPLHSVRADGLIELSQRLYRLHRGTLANAATLQRLSLWLDTSRGRPWLTWADS